jgi:iron(II)-dependent oxidoreductase
MTGFAAEVQAARARTDRLFSLLAPAALYERPVPERHRLIFYVGHLEAFDWNLLGRDALDLPSFQPSFDKLFAFGIDPEPGKQPEDKPSDWPPVEQVQEYVAGVREKLDSRLADAPEQYVNTAIEHRLMHAETFSYLMHHLAPEQKRSAPARKILDARTPKPAMIEIPAGRATLGQPRDRFGWDNEFDEHAVNVPSFAISKHKITNAEYLAFVEDGAPAPHFWVMCASGWHYRSMFGLVPLPAAWPAYVTQEEAASYARWAGKSLITEPQYHRAAYGARDGGERWYPWSDGETPHRQTPGRDTPRGNFNFAQWDPVAVDATPGSDSDFGVTQLVGNGWEWTSTIFAPFPGFESFPYYPGYSRDFFDGRHYVMKGASPLTADRFLRRSFRNWFRPNYPYVYATFHIVDN